MTPHAALTPPESSPPSHSTSDRATPGAVSDALVLAAGTGSRLGIDHPKPIFRLLGVPLLARTLFTLKEAGVTDAYVVVGYGAAEVRREIEAIDRLDLRLHWIESDCWERPNGWSVLAAEQELEGPFLLTMADHVFGASAVRSLLANAQGGDGIDLLVDRRLDRIEDIDEATKVRLEGGAIVEIGKSLDRYDAVDTGLFLASPAIFRTLRESVIEGCESLSDGVQLLADAGLARAVDGGEFTWHDVDTPEDATMARRKLMANLRSPEDGPIARRINRPISGVLSRLLVRTSITPSQVSVGTLGVGLLSAALAAVGGYLPLLASGLLFQLASILDGVDGEIARLTFRTSRRGEWIDTICDNLTYLAFLLGLTVGAYRSGLPDLYLWAGAVAVAAAFVGITNITLYLVRAGDSGSARAVRYGYREPSAGADWRTWLPRLFHNLGKRDMFAFLVMLMAVAGILPLALPLFAGAAVLLLVPYTIGANLRQIQRSRAAAGS